MNLRGMRRMALLLTILLAVLLACVAAPVSARQFGTDVNY